MASTQSLPNTTSASNPNKLEEMSSVVPTNTPSKSIPEIWEAHYMDMLNEVLASGKTQKKYKNSTVKRVLSVFSITGCSLTFCSPCIFWDCMCCCVSVCMKNNPFKWGAGFEFVSKSCEDTFEDTRVKDLNEIKLKNLNKTVIMNVLRTYLQKFDECIATKTVEGSRKANILRAIMVDIIRKYSPGFEYMMLRDDGDTLKLREIIRDLPAKFDRYGNSLF